MLKKPATMFDVCGLFELALSCACSKGCLFIALQDTGIFCVPIRLFEDYFAGMADNSTGITL